MAKKVKVGIVGCGEIAFGKHLPSLGKLEAVELVAFCDINLEKAERAAREYGIEDAVVCESYQDLLNDESIDDVHVLTPNRSHAEISIAALEAGKHVFCEKPMAKTASEAKQMLDTAKRTGKKLTIGYDNRFSLENQHLHKLASEGELGEIYYVKARAVRRRGVPTWGVFLNEEEQGGGPLIDIGSHAVDLALWMMDNYKPKSVMGNVYHKLGKREKAVNEWGPWDPVEFKVEDSAFGFVTMENGATILVESSWALNTLDEDPSKAYLSGTEAGAELNRGLIINGEEHGKLYTKKVDLRVGGTGENHRERQVRLWIDNIINDTEPVVKPEEAYVATQILEAIYESAKTGKAVYFE